MTPEVKKRIEQIRQGIVPEGYKKTKTDIVPADWKESPIGKYIREYTEKTTIPNQYPVLTSARTGLMLQTDYYSNRQVTTEDNVGYNVLPYGYITFRSRSDDGRFRFNKNRIIERGVISYFYPVFSFSEEVCHEYMLYLLNFSIYRRMYPYAEGTAQQVLSLKKLGQLKYSLPLVAEQKKIAKILATQDKAIELQARKIEELKRFKKGCLEKMFPRKGQKVPEKRFPRFTDDWEQRKLGDSCKLNGRIGFRGYTEKDIVTKEIGGVLTFSPTNIVDNKLTMECKNTYITREKYDESPEIKIFNGDILFVKTGSTLGKSALVTGLKEDASINPQIVVMRVEKDKETFMSNVLITDGIKKQVTAVKIGGAVPTMTETELKNIKYYEPVEKEEQKRIGQYFEHLDHLITLHQRKCEKLKALKKFMLQNMFI